MTSISPAPIAKTLINRLSFWSKPHSLAPTLDTIHTADGAHEAGDGVAPEAALQQILAAGEGQVHESAEERNIELRRKIIREVVRQYSSGCMFYALDFGKYTLPHDSW